MADIISVLVVLVFVVIVFRKRLALLFKGRKVQEDAVSGKDTDADAHVPEHQKTDAYMSMYLQSILLIMFQCVTCRMPSRRISMTGYLRYITIMSGVLKV